jgi:hypothetical protein
MFRAFRGRAALLVGLPLLSLMPAGCVKDPEIEDETVPPVGVEQPAPGGATIGAAEACSQLVDAEMATRAQLGCDESPVSPTCPDRLFLAGSQPCDEYDEASVAACVKAVKAYRHCADFDTNPCVVTVVESSCRAPKLPEAGVVREAGTEAGVVRDGAVPVPDGQAPGDGQAPAAPEGGRGDGGSSVPTDAAPDGAPSPVDAGPG